MLTQNRWRSARRAGLSVWLALAGLAAAEAQELPRAPVQVIEAAESSIRQVLEFAGSVTARRASSLSAATAGLVAELRVDTGDRVAAGDVLLRLDDELARLQLASDQASRRQVEQAAADARRRLREARELVEKRTIAETAVRDLESEVIEDEAQLARVTAIADRSKATLDRHTLVAPFSGVISARSTEIGEWVTPGAALLELVSLEKLYVDMQVSEAYLGAIEPGMPVSLRLAGAADEVVAARVAATVPVTDPTARTFLVRAEAESAPAAMLPGVSVTARLALDTRRQRVTVPRDAVLRYADGRSVCWVVQAVDGIERADERLVDTGLSFEGQIEIISGIRAGERVVVVGNESLRDDQPVRILSGG